MKESTKSRKKKYDPMEDPEYLNFLSYAEMMEEPPNMELAEHYLYGEYGSVEAAEEPVPEWFWDLPIRAELGLPDEEEE
jgi:hypothetical protein